MRKKYKMKWFDFTNYFLISLYFFMKGFKE